MANYAWIIDTDHFTLDEGKAKGTIGPRGATEANVTQLMQGEGEPFQMYDDDGDLIYEGRLIRSKHDDNLLFCPLDDFGEPNFGCTEIHYKNAKGKFEQI